MQGKVIDHITLINNRNLIIQFIWMEIMDYVCFSVAGDSVVVVGADGDGDDDDGAVVGGGIDVVDDNACDDNLLAAAIAAIAVTVAGV
jgi:hypothetical protein